jgi:hypothetical protein
MNAESTFRWRSRLGVAVGVFLLYGLFNVFAAIQVPLTQHAKGITMPQIMSSAADSRVLGKDISTLAQSDRALSDYMVAFMDTMCMEMMAFGILQIAIVWFALRRRQPWALGALLVADLSFIPYLAGWTSIFSRYGATWAESLASFGGTWVIVTVLIAGAAALGWSDLNRAAAPA